MPTDNFGRITGLILTYNEAPNIGRTLAKIGGLKRIVIVDSGSDDGTREILARHANVSVLERPFDNFANQWNFGLGEVGIDTEWVLSLDADYVLSDELVAEIARLPLADGAAGYRARFRYSILGYPIRSGVYPPVIVLFRRERARFVQDGHTQRIVVDGRIENLAACIYHDDQKPLSRWLTSQRTYAQEEAELLLRRNRETLRRQDRIRLLVGVAPVLMFVYVYLLRGGFLDGRHGLYYALQRAYAELLLSIELLDRRLRSIGGR